MDYLAMYDIAEPKRLRRVEKVLKGYGVRVQKSVFECSIDEHIKNMMLEAVKNIIDFQSDSFRVYPLLSNSRNRQEIIGTGEFIEFKQGYLI